MHGDEPAVADEDIELDRAQAGLLDVELHGVGDEEHVLLVVDVLVALVRIEGVLDREVVQPELVGQAVQLLLRRIVEIDPHDVVTVREQVGDGVEVVDRDELLPPVRTCRDRAHRIVEAT